MTCTAWVRASFTLCFYLSTPPLSLSLSHSFDHLLLGSDFVSCWCCMLISWIWLFDINQKYVMNDVYEYIIVPCSRAINSLSFQTMMTLYKWNITKNKRILVKNPKKKNLLNYRTELDQCKPVLKSSICPIWSKMTELCVFSCLVPNHSANLQFNSFDWSSCKWPHSFSC